MEQDDRIRQLLEHYIGARLRGEATPDLDQLCCDSPELVPPLEELIGCYEAVERGLSALGAVPATDANGEDAGPSGAPPEIANHLLLEKLGEGGMGEVWVADQLEPIRRRVAVKVLKTGLDAQQVTVRFEAERQALALMEHANIAKVLDAGVTAAGRPYFSLEYVRGLPITELCDDRRLDVEGRIGLFLQVCDGVQHAHQRGIIHRDLKPSNVLVADVDGEAVPKIIDFGIAKASLPLAQSTLVTVQGQFLGTPEYMSPEQADPFQLDVDSRTDVYSLGVILYELLVGIRPWSHGELARADTEAIFQHLAQREPLPPSLRLSGLPDRGRTAAELRGADSGRLARRLRGDLDWIVLEALAADRERRYGSVSELAADLRRHLDHRPVLAGPPSTLYRLRKYARRHRRRVAAAAVLLVALLGGVVGLTVGLLRATRAEHLAVAEAAKAEAVNAFLQDVLGSADPYLRLGREATVGEALDEAARRIDQTFAAQPEVRAAVLDTIGETYRKLGRYEEAAPLLREALAIRRRLHGDEHADVASSLDHLGRLQQSAFDLDAAEGLHREALAIRRRLFGNEHPLVAASLHEIGILLADRGEYEASGEILREALAMRRRTLGGEHVDIAESLGSLASLLQNVGESEEAEPLFRQALAMQERLLGSDDLMVARTQNSLGLMLQAGGAADEAEALVRQALATRRERLGPEHPDVAESLNHLSIALSAKGDFEGAETVLRELLSLNRQLLGSGHPDVARTLHNLASVLSNKGEYDKAERLYREALEISRIAFGPEHSVVGIALYNLANLLLSQDEPLQALEPSRQATAILEQALPGHWRTAAAKGLLGRTLLELGWFAEAEPLLLHACSTMEEARGRGSSAHRKALGRVLRLYLEWDKVDEAAAWRAQLEGVEGEAES
jgi:tetratricopeptide (TPR) repeat protein